MQITKTQSVSSQEQVKNSADSMNSSGNQLSTEVRAQNLSNFTTIQSVAMTKLQTAMMLKELLNIPKDLKDFLMQMLDSKDSPESLLKLLNDPEVKIELAELKLLLDTNAKGVTDKLLKLIKPGIDNFESMKQIKEMLSNLNQIVPQNPQHPQDIVKNTILLYLPWLPLPPPQELQIEIKEDEKEKAKSDKDSNIITMYITTKSLGIFKITIRLNDSCNLTIDVEKEESDDENVNADLIEKTLAKIKDEISKLNVPNCLNVYNHKIIKPIQDKKRKIAVQQSQNVSPHLIMAAHIVAKIIFEADEQVSLSKEREKTINKKENS